MPAELRGYLDMQEVADESGGEVAALLADRPPHGAPRPPFRRRAVVLAVFLAPLLVCALRWREAGPPPPRRSRDLVSEALVASAEEGARSPERTKQALRSGDGLGDDVDGLATGRGEDGVRREFRERGERGERGDDELGDDVAERGEGTERGARHEARAERGERVDGLGEDDELGDRGAGRGRGDRREHEGRGELGELGQRRERGGRHERGDAAKSAALEARVAAKMLAAAAAAAEAARAKALAELERLCGGDGGNVNCFKSQCCARPGHQCYARDNAWAECMEECTPGPNLFDANFSGVWSCLKLGPRKAGSPKTCSAGGENCVHTGCCSGLGMQCYRKNASFGRCKAACEPGTDMADSDWAPWTCEEVGERSKMPAEWIERTCAKGPENCLYSQCCVEEGFQCYLGNKYWGQCKPRCVPWQWDSCAPIGSRAPKLASMIMAAKGRVGPWVEQRCSGRGEDCSFSKCCHEVGATCFARDQEYATCRPSCNSTAILLEENATWSCAALGPRSWGLATRGYPSLYCISLYMPERYEGPLLKSVLKRGAGIFACDGFDVFANKNDTLGFTDSGMGVRSVVIPKIKVGVSQDGTAGNTELFMAVWDRIIRDGRYRYYDWTIKVDPDAVLLPWRLRDHLASHVGEKIYIVNCDKYPMSPNFPMMYGALEVFSQAAMAAYAEGSWRCRRNLPWQAWGEDYFMTHCMDHIGVGRFSDFGILGDMVCIGSDCGDPGVASFHPFKSIETWHKCWNRANRLPAGSDEEFRSSQV